MRKLINYAVPLSFNILFFFTPLIIFPKTSELFEFNKVTFIYLITTLIVAAWLTKMILAKKLIFRRTILDIPLLIFLLSQFLSFIFSIDRRTSLLGYYGRFNGGLISTLCYSLLYWAFVANMEAKSTKKSLYFLLASAFLVSIYGVLQHFGIDKDLWVQDVQNRIFSTLGQPNWLATFLIALIPLTWAQLLKTKRIVYWSLSVIFMLALFYTKSRSGLLGLIMANFIFWGGLLWARVLSINSRKSFLKTFVICHMSFVILALLVGTPWNLSLEQILVKNISNQPPEQISSEPGGTESGEIRKIVWKGAIEVWRHYPLFGSGIETFAYSFYEFRPKEHNLVSEWDFLFNKAHNEYLNFAATTGSLGLTAYFILIVASLYQICKNLKNPKFQNSKQIQNQNENISIFNSRLLGDFEFLRIGVLSGYIGILVANFFGFSTTTTSLLFFLFPAIASSLTVQSTKYKVQKHKLSAFQTSLLFFLLCTMLYSLFTIFKYWYSDLLYAKGRVLSSDENFTESKTVLEQAINLNPKEAVIQNELAQTVSLESSSLEQKGEIDAAKKLAEESLILSQNAISLSPRNLSLIRSRSGILIRLSSLDPIYIHEAKNVMLLEAKYSPTDAKLYYNLGLAYAKIGQYEDAIGTLEKTVELKQNYKEARLALALLYVHEGREYEAVRELKFIIENIDANDPIAQQELHELTGK